MFFGNNDITVRLCSVHLLTWGHRDVMIPPKKTFALSYRMTGECRFLTEGDEIVGSTGDIFYFPKGVGYHITAGRERLIGINFEAEGDMPLEIKRMSPRGRPFFETAFNEIYRAWSERNSGFYARAMSYFYRIISEIVRESEESALTPGSTRLRPVIAYINSHYPDADLSVSRLAECIGVSDTYLRRLFKRELGELPLDYINRLRISYATEYLESGFYNIESVAEMCGFSDAKYFSTVFKRYRGMPPSEYLLRNS